MRRTRNAAVHGAAMTVHKIAVLLEAGVAPSHAWQLLAEDGDPVAGRVVSSARGTGIAEALRAERGPWQDVAAAWHVAEVVGAPLASSLRRFADALRDAEETRDDVAVALADPTATARLVAWLPLVAIALALLLGFDIAAVVTQPAGVACLLTGFGLMLAARRWTARLVARAQPGVRLAGVQSDIVAIALSGGVSVERAISTMTDAGGGEPTPGIRAVLDLSQRAGAPAVDLLRASAAQERRHARTEGRLRAARLGAKLLLPMGLCTLPAFLLLGVAPMLLSVLSGAVPTLAEPASMSVFGLPVTASAA